jgi:DNA-binding protein H-NS
MRVLYTVNFDYAHSCIFSGDVLLSYTPQSFNIFGENMTSLIDIQSQIAALQKQEQEIKANEFQNTLQDIVAKMQAFGIGIKDIIAANPALASNLSKPRNKVAGVKPAKAARKSLNPVAAKYRGPNGESWSGRGLTPRWLSSLVEQGQSKESFAVEA